MLLINMSGHPAPKGAERFDRVIDIPVPKASLTPEGVQNAAEDLVARAEAAAGDDFRAGRFELLLPGLTPLTAAVLAVVHGRVGYLPVIRYAVHEDGPDGRVYFLGGPIDLHALRHLARVRG